MPVIENGRHIDPDALYEYASAMERYRRQRYSHGMYGSPAVPAHPVPPDAILRECRSCGVEGVPGVDDGTGDGAYLNWTRPTNENRGWYCQECTWWCDECDSYSVGECDNEHDSTSDLINSYSYRPRPVFYGTTAKNGRTTYLGMELEVDTDGGSTRELAEIAVGELGDRAYLKEDGSVDGFEIVTHPMTYRYAVEHFPWDMLHRLDRDGAAATSSCGLHVHVNRDAFDSPAHVYRWMKLIYRNQEHVTRVARRHSSEWAAFSDEMRREQKSYCKGQRGSMYSYTPRYSAINVLNDATFEVRVFASSLEPDEVKSALALVDASVEYTRQLDSHKVARENGWTWEAFMNWLPEKYAVLKEAAREEVYA